MLHSVALEMVEALLGWAPIVVEPGWPMPDTLATGTWT
jgi:hypothetical protein